MVLPVLCLDSLGVRVYGEHGYLRFFSPTFFWGCILLRGRMFCTLHPRQVKGGGGTERLEGS